MALRCIVWRLGREGERDACVDTLDRERRGGNYPLRTDSRIKTLLAGTNNPSWSIRNLHANEMQLMQTVEKKGNFRSRRVVQVLNRYHGPAHAHCNLASRPLAADSVGLVSAQCCAAGEGRGVHEDTRRGVGNLKRSGMADTKQVHRGRELRRGLSELVLVLVPSGWRWRELTEVSNACSETLFLVWSVELQ